MASRRKVYIRKGAKKAVQRIDDFSGGRLVANGYTASADESMSLERIEKGLYGLFESDIHGPHYGVIEGDILQHDNGVRVLEPIYGFKDLLKVYMTSAILRQCVDSYVTNIESYGTTLEYIGPEGQEKGIAAQNEKRRIERLMATLTSDERSLQEHRNDSRVDKEVLGARAFEVIKDNAGRVVGFDHVPTLSLRMTTKERDPTAVTFYDPTTGASKNLMRRFRRFVQMDDRGKKTWFKELGDPRKIDPETGKINNALDIEDEATEIFYEGLYCPGTPTGVPRWAGVIPSLLGAREAEMVNLNFFRDNAIPAMAILVSGGALTEESFDKINQYITGVRGGASMNRIVVMEAMADGADAAAIDGSMPAPRVDIKPLTSERQSDGHFKDYIHEGAEKARSSFRLPPIYIGSAEDYNRASAFASVLTADQQIFIPERAGWDTMFERVVLDSHGIKYWRVKSQGPGMQDPAEVARVVNSLGREGALTANIAIKLANRYLDADIQPIMEEWGNIPFALVMQYIKAGDTIKGLDVFEERIEEALPPPEDDELDMRDANVPLVKTIKRLLDGVADKLKDDLDDAVQSIASERELA